MTAQDPYLRPAFSVGDRVYRLAWGVVWTLLYRTSPRPLHAWRSMLLRLFGAQMGPKCHFYPRSRIWSPRMLVCEDQVTVGDDGELYNPARLFMGSHAIVSQGAYICGATHDYNNPAFPLYSLEMRLGARSWVCARACVSPGVSLGEGAVLGLASVATHDLEPWSIYAGVPARKIRDRVQTHPSSSESLAEAHTTR